MLNKAGCFGESRGIGRTAASIRDAYFLTYCSRTNFSRADNSKESKSSSAVLPPTNQKVSLLRRRSLLETEVFRFLIQERRGRGRRSRFLLFEDSKEYPAHWLRQSIL